MPKFFVPYPIAEGETKIVIHDEDCRHIRDVLRMKAGEAINVCDTNGMDHGCVVDSFEKEAVVVRILSSIPSDNESPFDIVIYQGLPKADKMEVIIQKCVELGGTTIVPVSCARSVVKWNDKKDIEKKLLRWNKIAYEAAKQCNRSAIPRIGSPVSYKEALTQMKQSAIAFIPWELEEQTSIKTILKQAANVFDNQNEQGKKSESRPRLAFMIGPEGGFDREEILAAQKSGIDTITLGKRILRTETAAPSILAMILYEMEL